MLDVGGARDAVGERRDIGRSAHFLELTRASEPLQRDEVDRLAALAQHDHLVEDPRCASRKKSRESISSAAALNASLCMRMAPRTDFSASRLCGSARSGLATASAMLRRGVYTRRSAHFGHRDLDLRGHVAMNLDRHHDFAELFQRFRELDATLVDLETLLLERLRDVRSGD